MTPNCHPFYKHSGKFGIHGPVLALVAGAVLALLLGYAYAYLVRWIPFIYLNFLLTAGYGLAFGLSTAVFMKLGKVRNSPVAAACGLVVGLLACYGNWNAYVHTLVSDAPWVLSFDQISEVMKVLLKEGTWSLGRRSTEPVTGFLLGTVWVAEAAIIVGASTLLGYSSVSRTPYCETHECWLDEEKVMDKLDAIVHPDYLAAFQAGDIAPLEVAQPRIPASGRFARLTLKHSPKCDDFCAFSIANVEVSVNKDGKQEEKVDEVMTNLWVPKSMFEYLAQFDHATAKVRPGI